MLAGLTAGCTNDDTNPLDDELQSSTDTTNQNNSGGDTDDEATTSSSSTSEPQPEAELDELATIWQQRFTATGLPADQRTPALQTIEALDPTVIETADGLLLDLATAAPNQNGTWTITNLQRQTRHCVPAELAQGALNGYQAYFEADSEYWNPPDPNHPGIQATLTGNMLEQIPERLRSAKADGRYLVNQDTSHPEVVDVFAPDRIVVSDCREVDAESGIFDAGGNDIGGTQRTGAKDLYRVEMLQTEAGWKARSVEVLVGTPCEHAPIPAGRPLI